MKTARYGEGVTKICIKADLFSLRRTSTSTGRPLLTLHAKTSTQIWLVERRAWRPPEPRFRSGKGGLRKNYRRSEFRMSAFRRCGAFGGR